MDIIFENDFLIAVNKPAGMLSIPDRVQSEPSLKDLLVNKYKEIYTIHRLDKQTSGIILFAKDAQTHKIMSEKFQSRAIDKFYLGLINGSLLPASGRIEAAINPHPAIKGKMIVHAKGKPSVTDYETLETFKNFSLVKYQIHTGRTHQIRVHTQYLGSSIVCDELYGNGKPVFISEIKKDYKLSKKELEEKPVLNRLALHSSQLQFEFNTELFTLEAALPKDMRALILQLRKHQ